MPCDSERTPEPTATAGNCGAPEETATMPTLPAPMTAPIATPVATMRKLAMPEAGGLTMRCLDILMATTTPATLGICLTNCQ